MGTEFYKRIQDAIVFLLKGKTSAEIDDAMLQIQSQQIKEEWVEHYQTLLILSAHYEQEIIKNKFFTEEELDTQS